MPSERIIKFIPHRTSAFIQWSSIFIVISVSAILAAENELTKLMFDITNGPTSYYSPEAYSYFTRKGHTLPSQKSRDKAMNSFRATIRQAACLHD